MITLRKVTSADQDILFQWRNDPLTVQQSLSARPVTFEEHTEWFRQKLASHAASLFFICEKDGEPCGQIRFDPIENYYLISLLVAPEHRGNRLAPEIINAGVAECIKQYPGSTIQAIVKTQNIPSLKAFERAGFIKVHEEKGTALFKLNF